MTLTPNLRLVESSSFIFAGTITSSRTSPLRVLKPLSGLLVVRFDGGFLVNPVLGNLTGRGITVQPTANQAAPGGGAKVEGRFIFFTTAWVHADEIAVTELARVPAKPENEKEVANLVASLPERHLQSRIASAALIVTGRVAEITRASDIPPTGSEHLP